MNEKWSPERVAAYQADIQALQAERRSYDTDLSIRQQAYHEGADVVREIALTDLQPLTRAIARLDLSLRKLPKSQAVEADMEHIWTVHDELEQTLLNGKDQP